MESKQFRQWVIVGVLALLLSNMINWAITRAVVGDSYRLDYENQQRIAEQQAAEEERAQRLNDGTNAFVRGVCNARVSNCDVLITASTERGIERFVIERGNVYRDDGTEMPAPEHLPTACTGVALERELDNGWTTWGDGSNNCQVFERDSHEQS